MSHLYQNQIAIHDLDILKKAVAGFGGLKWNEGATTFRWYVTNKYDKKQLESEQGKCEHSISIKGCSYEVGVVRRKDGDGWSLVFDPLDTKAADIVGRQCEKIVSAYAEEYTRDWASKKGFILEESVDDEGNKVFAMIDNG